MNRIEVLKAALGTAASKARLVGNCIGCGNAIYCRKRKYCTKDCRLENTYSHRPILVKRCEWCWRQFETRSKRIRCCSANCGQKLRWNADGVDRRLKTCEYCGEQFKLSNGSRRAGRFCSRGCAFKCRANREMLMPCHSCGKQFMCGGGGRPKWCEVCSSNQRKQQKAANLKRCALRRGASFSETFTREEIFDRDGWRCCICGKKIRMGISIHHKLSPELDHIIPVSKGGPHTKENVQCVHRICNLLKSDTLAGHQLRLIG